MTTDRKKQDEAAIRALIADWSRAIEAKDPDAIVRAYTPDTILFDAIPPYRTVGAEAIAALWRQCLPFFPEVLRSEHRDLQIDIDGDLAFMHGFHRFVPEPADHPCGMTWMRVSACYRRIEGQWRIVHEHVSVPFDPMKNTPFFMSDFDKVAEALDFTAASPVHSVTPHLVCAGAGAAIDFYQKAFGAIEMMRLPAPDGRLMHGCVTINGSTVMVVDEFPEMGNAAPTSLNGTPVTIHLTVDDVDAWFARALKAGATEVMPVADMFWGDRYGVVADPFGHHWSLATTQKTLTPEQILEAAKSAEGCQ